MGHLLYTQGVLGSPGGQHCESLVSHVLEKVASSSKLVMNVRQRISHFRRDFVRHGGD